MVICVKMGDDWQSRAIKAEVGREQAESALQNKADQYDELMENHMQLELQVLVLGTISEMMSQFLGEKLQSDRTKRRPQAVTQHCQLMERFFLTVRFFQEREGWLQVG